MVKILISLLVLLSVQAGAEQLSPEDVASRLLDGYKTGRYELTVSVIDPAELKAFSEGLRDIFCDKTKDEANPKRAAMFGDNFTNEDLLTMTDATLVAKYLEAYVRLLGRRSNAAPVQVTKFVILGHINEGPDVAHVLARVTAGDASFAVTALRPVTTKKINGVWKAQLDESAKALLQKLRSDR